MSDQAITLQREAAHVLDSYLAALEPAKTNPIATLQQTGQGDPPSIASLAAPEPRDGQSLIVTVTPVPQAVTYRVYVSHHESGHGGTVHGQGPQPTLRLHQLPSDTPLWLFVTTVDKDGNESKPSLGRSVVLKDEFPMK